ncbi:MAG: helix-turn-helix domain-containing protein [Pseudomonadota bacterium]
MNKLSTKQRAQILHMLVEGNSLRATARMADVSRNTVDKLLRDAGEACLDYQDSVLRDLPCKRVQCNEIWSFVYAKQKNVAGATAAPEKAGDIWTWTAVDADTKLVPCWHLGNRDLASATAFIDDLAARLTNRVQLTMDGHRPYLEAVEGAFGADIDYARLIEIYGTDKAAKAEKRYSPAKFIEAKCGTVSGNPEQKHISTSYVEHQNRTMRMSMRRFAWLTNGFSKKIENHMHAISLHYMHYNFCRIHNTLKVTPAMEAGIAESVYDPEFIVSLIDERAPSPNKRGPYKRRAISN